MEITIKNLEHRYGIHSPFERTALKDVNLSLSSGTFIAVIGHTGSGKSTLIQHFNGLLKPTSGAIKIGSQTIQNGEKPKQLKQLRKKVGMVFQFPEHQLFEETVERDICFGPLNFGVPESLVKQRAKKVLAMVGLDESILTKSPFELSGGQMRRVAIAGVLAMTPEVLILDEPTAGLDPRGQQEMMSMFYKLHQENRLTTVLVTHRMKDAAAYADHIVVMNKGTVYLEGTPEEVFSTPETLKEVGLNAPETVQFIDRLEKKFGKTLTKGCFSLDEVAKQVEELF